MNKEKRVVSIQDISCFGKCSETVALPILSAAGVETVILPTAILSTHTGGFTGYTFKDLSDQLELIVNHWKSLDLTFDGIVTGYVGSLEMIEKIKGIMETLRNQNTLIMCDPAMADNGVLYPGFDLTYAKAMKVLCDKANIIIPNITEASLMCDCEYSKGPYTKQYIEKLLKQLTDNGPQIAILTGVYFTDKELGAAGYDRQTGKYVYAFNTRIEGYYHGTGDIFASAFYGAYLQGNDLQTSLQIAVDFTRDSIQRTYEAKTDVRYGVNFEAGLGEYANKIVGK